VLILDGVELPTKVRYDMVTTARVEHFATLDRGEYPLVLFDPASGERLSIGDLNIRVHWSDRRHLKLILWVRIEILTVRDTLRVLPRRLNEL